jgi:hypothetical protein
MGVSLSDQISALRMEMKDALAKLAYEMGRQNAQQTNCQHQVVRVDISALAGSLTHAGDSGAALVTMLNILEDLRFEGMSRRYTSVRKAHTGTFDWAFSNQLSDWLRSDDTLFWITGKPGSGKSTLMKRLVDDPQTSHLLCEWSGAQTLVVASYFYWIKGTELQRSDVGLLRCILYDYLRQCPTVMPHVFPDLWANNMAKMPSRVTVDWKREDLIQAFRRLTALDTKSAHLCLFIDGLDEYQGDHQDLIEIIQYLSQLKIKICVASRPWNVFEETFGRLPQLRMQDLNEPDIQLYVRDKLFHRQDFQRARVATDDMDIIMSEITKKSRGVFLWVYLVVSSLIDGLRNSDPMSLLMKRLSSFPSDLKEFFRDIFESLDPIYRNRTAKMFLLTLETMNPPITNTFQSGYLTTLTHWYLDELEEQPGFPLPLQVIEVDEDTILQHSAAASLRINGRCKGLLEMIPGLDHKQGLQQGQSTSPYWFEVTFLHRTVADFLETPNIQRMLNEWLEEDLDSWSLICRATLAEIRTLVGLTTPQIDVVWPAVSRFLKAVFFYEKTRGSTLMPLMDELSRILTHRGLSYPLAFARITAEYDLLIYMKSSPSTQQWIQQPDLKVAVLEGTVKYAPDHGLVFNSHLRCEMICLIHSMGPTVAIEENTQKVISDDVKDRAKNDEEYIEMIRRLSRTAYFALTPDTARSELVTRTRFASRQLHDSLVDIIGEEQAYQLAESCLQPVEAGKKKETRLQPVEAGKKKETCPQPVEVSKKKEKKKKKNLFRKIFR